MATRVEVEGGQARGVKPTKVAEIPWDTFFWGRVGDSVEGLFYRPACLTTKRACYLVGTAGAASFGESLTVHEYDPWPAVRITRLDA